MDLTLLAGTMQEVAREVRLMRLQLDNLASRLAGQEGRVGALEQSFHDLVGEVSRGLGQVQQQITRQEKRLEAVDGGLAALRAELAESTTRIVEAIGGKPR